MAGDNHIFSSWNTVTKEPIENCYTEILFESLLKESGGNIQEPVIIQGLGGGILPARLANYGIKTIVIELSRDVISMYNVFKPHLYEWSPNTEEYMVVIEGDALEILPVYELSTWIVSDMPPCYQDVSKKCLDMLHTLTLKGKRIIANIWSVYTNNITTFLGGRIINTNPEGVSVWTNVS